MIRISKVVKDIISKNMFLQFGFNNNLFNLTRLSKFLKPFIETKIQKDVTESALLMNLSRIQRTTTKKVPKLKNFRLENVTVHANLCTHTYYKNQTIDKKIHNFYTKIQKDDGYVTLTEGVSEITVITHMDYLEEMKKMIQEKSKREFINLSAVVVKFHPKYVDTPGMLFFLIQQITMQNINIIEISSTLTELIFYIEDRNTKLAFETIQNCFASS